MQDRNKERNLRVKCDVESTGVAAARVRRKIASDITMLQCSSLWHHNLLPVCRPIVSFVLFGR